MQLADIGKTQVNAFCDCIQQGNSSFSWVNLTSVIRNIVRI